MTRSGISRRGLAALAAAGYLLLTLVLTYPLLAKFARAIPGDGFDGWQNYWNLWWVKVALLQEHTQPFFTDLLYHPTGVGLLFHTLNPFNGLLVLPVQVAWGLLPAYNSVALFSFVVGGFGTYLLARQVLGPGRGRWPAFAAGVIFTFSPFHIAHLLGHMQVISLEWIPFYALYLVRIAGGTQSPIPNPQSPIPNTQYPIPETPHDEIGPRPSPQPLTPWRDMLLAALFLILIGLCDWYYVLYCLILTAVVLAWAAWRALLTWRADVIARRRTAPSQHLARPGSVYPRVVAATAGAWLIFGLALSPLLAPMIQEAQQFSFMVPETSQSRTLSADLLAFVTPQEFHPLWGAWAREQTRNLTSTVSEHQVFAGFTALGLAGLGLWAGWTSARRRAGDHRPPFPGPWPLTLLTFFLLALGPVLHVGGRTALLPGGREISLPYGWLMQVIPFVKISRSVSRFDVMVMLALAVLAAFGLAWLAQRGNGGRLAAAAAIGLILFEFLPAPYPMSPPDTPDFYAALARDPRDGAVLNLPMNWDRPGYLLYQTTHGKPLTVAYISREDPRTLTARMPVLQHFRHLEPDIIDFDLAAQGQQVLSDLDVRWVVLDRYKMPDGRERAVTEALAHQIFGDQPPIYQDDRLTVYEVTPPSVAAPYLILGVDWGPFDAETHSRAFAGSASLTIQAPVATGVTLRVTLAPGSPPLDLPIVDGTPAIALRLNAGANQIMLQAARPDQRVVVTKLALEQ